MYVWLYVFIGCTRACVCGCNGDVCTAVTVVLCFVPMLCFVPEYIRCVCYDCCCYVRKEALLECLSNY